MPVWDPGIKNSKFKIVSLSDLILSLGEREGANGGSFIKIAVKPHEL